MRQTQNPHHHHYLSATQTIVSNRMSDHVGVVKVRQAGSKACKSGTKNPIGYTPVFSMDAFAAISGAHDWHASAHDILMPQSPVGQLVLTGTAPGWAEKKPL